MKANVSSRRSAPDRRKPILYVTLGVIAVALVVTVAVLSRNPSVVPQSATETHAQSALKVGQKAPDFAVSTTAGPFDLATARTPVLLEVFATWCPHCQRETAILNTLYPRYKGAVNIVAVAGSPYAMDESQPESQADVVAFMQKFSIVYPVAFDPSLDVAGKYLQGGFPTVVLIGKDGLVQSIRDGEIPQADIAKALDTSLAGGKPDPKMGGPA